MSQPATILDNLPEPKVPGGPFRKGYDPRRATGDALRKGGRTPEVFKAMMARLASRKKTLKALAEILKNKDHPHFVAAHKHATAYGYGSPEAILKLEGEVTHNLLDVTAKDELISRINSLVERLGQGEDLPKALGPGSEGADI